MKPLVSISPASSVGFSGIQPQLSSMRMTAGGEFYGIFRTVCRETLHGSTGVCTKITIEDNYIENLSITDKKTNVSCAKYSVEPVEVEQGGEFVIKAEGCQVMGKGQTYMVEIVIPYTFEVVQIPSSKVDRGNIQGKVGG